MTENLNSSDYSTRCIRVIRISARLRRTSDGKSGTLVTIPPDVSGLSGSVPG